jgi:heme oxygenase
MIDHHTDALGALRSATAGRHALLDAGLPIGGAHANLSDYRAHLCMLRHWLAPLECWLAGFDDGPQAALELVLRVPLIDADLADRAMPEAAPAGGDDGNGGWPLNASAAYRWGVCYVIEGSQLGGAVLYQRLSAALAPHQLAYLRGAPDGPGPRWRLFMQGLRAHVTTEADIAQACAGACDAFDRILALRA